MDLYFILLNTDYFWENNLSMILSLKISNFMMAECETNKKHSNLTYPF